MVTSHERAPGASQGLSHTLRPLAVAGFVSGASMRVAEPLLPKLAADFTTTIAAAAVVITAFTLAYGLFQIVHGALGDRFGKLRTVAWALLFSFLGCLACASASSLSALALFRFATGMTASAVIPLSLALIADQVPYERRQVVLGRFISGILLGQACGPLIGGAIGDLSGWRASFLVLGAGYLASGAWLLLRLGSAPPPTSVGAFNPLRQYGRLLRRLQVRRVLAAVSLEGLVFFGAFAFVGAFLRDAFSLGYTAIGLILAGFGAGGVAYSIFVRALHVRLGESGLVRTGGALLLIAFAGLALLGWWLLAVPLLVLLGLSFYMMHNTLQTRATEMAPDARGSAVALFASCLFLSQSVGISIAGAIVQASGYRWLLAAAGVALAALGIWIGMRRADSRVT